MISTIWLLLFCGIISEHLASSQKSTKVKKNNLKVHINATGDTLVMKFLRPNENLKLEGFVLGYGSNFFSNQYIQWPENGKSYVTEVDAEPRYLIALKPNENSKKTCKDKNPAAKPLQLVIGTLTPTSTFLSWGILINPQIDWSVLNKCPNDRFYTVRYREKNKDWMYQLCPTTEIVIDSLKPSTMYEFGVKDNTENGIWSKLYNHKTIPAKSKDNGQIQSTNKISKAILQMASEDTKALIPVTVIKQGFLNLTYFNSQTKTASESTTEKHKATEPPSIPKTTKKPNTEVYKPAVTDQPIVEYLTTDSPTGALELVRGTMESLESQSVYPSSKTFAYVNHGEPQNNPAIQRMSTASFQPKNSYTEWSISTPRTIGLPLVSRMISAPDAITEITIPKAQSGFTQVEREKEMYTQDSTEKSEITNVMDVSPEIYPISTNVPDVNSHIPLEHHGKTVGLPSISPTFLPSANITWKTTEEQTSTKQVTGINEPYTEDDLNITENQDTGNGLPIVPSTLTSHLEITKKMPALIMLTSSKQGLPLVSSTLSPTSAVTMKKTPVPEDPTSLTQAEMFPASPDDRQVSLYTPFQQLRTTMGLPLIPTTSSPILDLTMKITRISGVQTSTSLAENFPESSDLPQQSTNVPLKQQRTTLAEMFPTSPDDRQVSPYTPFQQLRTTMGLPLIPPTSSPFLDLTMKITSIPGVQLSTSLAENFPESSDLPQQSTNMPLKQRTTLAEIVPESTDVPQASTDKLHTHYRTTEATKDKQSMYIPATISSLENEQTPHESSIHSGIYSSPLFQNTASPSVELVKSLPVPTNPHHFAKTEVPVVPHEIPYLQTSKPSPSTEAPRMESGKNSTQSVSETITTEVPHIFEQEKVVATTEEQYVQELGAVSKPETKPTTVQMSSSPSAPKETLATEKPLPKFDPKETHHVPINVIRLHIFGDPNPTIDTTEKSISPKPRATTESPSSTAAPTTMKKMPIHIIKLHIFDNPEATAPSENLTTSSPTPKTTQPHTISQSKPAPKPTQRVPINDISHQLYGDPEVSLVSNTARPPPLPKTTQRAETPQTKPVPNETRKVFPYKPKKPQPTAQPRKPASTEAPGDSIKPKIPPQTPEATFAPYKLQHSSQRPRTSVGSRINPGGRLYDRSKLLGVSRNISVEVNTTIRRTYSVSSAPFLPVQPTIMRRRPHATNVTGRPGSVLMPRAPSTARPNRTAVSIKAPIPSSASPEPEDTVEATVFSPTPKSEIDALGKIRTTGPHITYMTKKQEHPCSITESLKYFPTEEATNQEIVSRPMNPPSNLTIVTVEGCPSFVILDWQPPENDTVTEYKIISTENGAPPGKDQSIITTNQTFQTVENLKPNASYQFLVIPTNPLGEGPASNTVEFSTESADPRVSEPVTGGKDAIWTEIKFKSDSYSECKGKQFVKRTWYKKFVGIQLCNSLRYKIYLSDSLLGTFYNIGDQSGFGEDHCQFVDSFLDGRTGQQLSPEQLTTRKGFYRAVRQQPVDFGNIGGNSQIRYVHWYECGIAIPGKW
ncbi:target of Nesh-SH3 isoform X8 [Xenopus tropicalis]|uniref:Target of Nesh-SH3 isoform X8 n=1 Tax=Xenopus tropicalis TaxID=8364 RepID=A0A8J1J220_XENTR|nr:target of Nesh-SH3 isoform X8 [Xenopus tropicalis]